MADLERYRLMLEEGNAVMNLVGPATLPDFWSRHALDSAQLRDHAPDARTWADLGAGAGLPGVVLAILLKGVEGARVWLIDSQTKRCRFLQPVVDALALPAEVIDARAETLKLKADVVTARACAPMDRLLDFADPYLKRGALGLFLKGEQAETELAEARRRRPRLDADLLPSVSDPRGRIVRIRSL
ncbi:16S rRNA (guanine(527)-N(7))-methyltransferase RsmG [Brevundimonas sp.]|uniref:16S rRNA (guanine(527)-N(7))-methyltransferase RsmG n=1 Tax=Brevundimonas sp. TaxID=1871086 RepID=UPI0025F6B1FB|nr:16S rRNA (guanine(527)-N(7))-methyltransferase RsmG [Brevundimonas sp.]